MDTVLARVALEPAPSATLLAALALLLLPIATALLPLAVAEPSIRHFSSSLPLNATQVALPPICTDCAVALPLMPNPNTRPSATASSAGVACVASRRWSTTPPLLLSEEASSEATTN